MSSGTRIPCRRASAEESPKVYADAAYMAGVDLIMQCMTMTTIERDEFEGLRAAVENGTGLAGWHGGIADSYRNSSDYLHPIGGQFACHPGKHPDERIGEQSDNYVPYTVNMLPAAAHHPTHVTEVLVHASGALSTLLMSFDAVKSKSANIEIHGERGSLAVPEPNHFDGDVQVFPLGADDWQTLPLSAGYVDSGRGFGIADLAATPQGSEPRAGGQLAYHVLDVMESMLASARTGSAVQIKSTAARAEPVELTALAAQVAEVSS